MSGSTHKPMEMCSTQQKTVFYIRQQTYLNDHRCHCLDIKLATFTYWDINRATPSSVFQFVVVYREPVRVWVCARCGVLWCLWYCIHEWYAVQVRGWVFLYIPQEAGQLFSASDGLCNELKCTSACTLPSMFRGIVTRWILRGATT